VPDGIDDLLHHLAATAATRRADVTPQRRRQYVGGLVAPFATLSAPRATTRRREVDGDLVREDVDLEVLPGLPFTVRLLLPARPTGGAALAVHGHGYGSRQVVGLLPDGTADTEGADGHHHFARALARRGLVVAAPDVLGFGDRVAASDRRFDADAPNACYRLDRTLALTGHSLAGLRTAELLGVLRWFRTRDEVAADRIGIMGHSGGSLLAALVQALDEDLAAGVLCGYPNTFAASILRVRHCACNYLPGVLDVADQADLLALMAPRPLFVESGSADPIFPPDGFAAAVATLRTAYAAAGVPDRLRADEHPGGHEVSGHRSLDWLAHQVAAPAPG